ncbi:hypothetical protein [Roseicella frigidaeris]|uniref:hypothetical protein n=1 Tax=Roseicella frigidaeris TaxID=2230885 RepID=UPI000FDF5F90|nr:hypothetical protein [Roseicella frigidaeris]
MPAKPLISVKRNARFIQDQAVIRRHPGMATLIATAITRWAAVEANLGTVLMILTGAKGAVAAAMYGSLKSPQARADTLRAVARVTLEADANRVFQAA